MIFQFVLKRLKAEGSGIPTLGENCQAASIGSVSNLAELFAHQKDPRYLKLKLLSID